MHSSFWRILKHLVTRNEKKVSALDIVWKKMSRLYREVFGLVQLLWFYAPNRSILAKIYDNSYPIIWNFMPKISTHFTFYHVLQIVKQINGGLKLVGKICDMISVEPVMEISIILLLHHLICRFVKLEYERAFLNTI